MVIKTFVSENRENRENRDHQFNNSSESYVLVNEIQYWLIVM